MYNGFLLRNNWSIHYFPYHTIAIHSASRVIHYIQYIQSNQLHSRSILLAFISTPRYSSPDLVFKCYNHSIIILHKFHNTQIYPFSTSTTTSSHCFTTLPLSPHLQSLNMNIHTHRLFMTYSPVSSPSLFHTYNRIHTYSSEPTLYTPIILLYSPHVSLFLFLFNNVTTHTHSTFHSIPLVPLYSHLQIFTYPSDFLISKLHMHTQLLGPSSTPTVRGYTVNNTPNTHSHDLPPIV
jgi:hypothetical protein